MQTYDLAVFRALAAALGLSPDSAEAARMIRRAYTNPAAPPPAEGKDAVYFDLRPEGRPPDWTETVTRDGHTRFFRLSPWRLHLVFYGPRAEALAWQVYHRLFEDGWQRPRRILRRAGIYPLPRPAGPVPVREELEKYHRPRMDLSLEMRVAAEITGPDGEVAAVAVPPEVLVHHGGASRTGPDAGPG